MDFTSKECDHYLTQAFMDKIYSVNYDTDSQVYDLIEEYGTSTISEIILGGMIIVIQSYDSAVPPDVTTRKALKDLNILPIFVGGDRVALD